MLCERCKIREANIQYTEVINGERTEHSFCAQCAKEMDFGPYAAIFDGELPLGKLLSGLLGLEETTQKKEQMSQVVCPTCRLTYEEFIQNSSFGCQDCYSVFDLLISDNLKQLQGSDAHCGKHPRFNTGSVPETGEPVTADLHPADGTAMSEKEQVTILNAKLKDAVHREDYETAARLRDQIKALKGGGTDAEMV
jgi:Uncharacterized protein with conserved CXXC pairs